MLVAALAPQASLWTPVAPVSVEVPVESPAAFLATDDAASAVEMPLDTPATLTFLTTVAVASSVLVASVTPAMATGFETERSGIVINELEFLRRFISSPVAVPATVIFHPICTYRYSAEKTVAEGVTVAV